ncbi:PilN domain-containing protein [bacterium]|nr:PilN domain-containing protein [bacterium]
MIKINLLPSEGPGTSKVYFEIMLGLILIAVAASAIGLYWNYLNGIIAKRQEEIRIKEEQVSKLQNIIDSVKKFEEEKAVLQKKIDLIKKLREQQKAPVFLLDQLSKSLPDNVWYFELKTKGTTMTLKGAALSMMSIGDLINQLKQPENLFKTVHLKKTSMKDLKGREIYTFEMNLGLEPQEKPAEQSTSSRAQKRGGKPARGQAKGK